MAIQIDLESAIRREIDRVIQVAIKEETEVAAGRINERVRQEIAGLGVRVAGMIDIVNDQRRLVITIKDETAQTPR